MWSKFSRMNALTRCAVICSLVLIPLLGQAQREAWIATWTASPEPTDSDLNQPVLNLQNQTVRERVRISVGGSQVRIRLSNEYGSSPLHVGSVTVAVPNDLASVKSGSIHTVTFGGRDSITIPAGAPALSDPVALPIAHGAEMSISLYFPKRVTAPTWHALALKRAVISQGDDTHKEKIQGGTEVRNLILVSAVLVPSPPSQRVIVAFGDSIVDGDGSTVDADRNWPSDLMRRLGKTPEDSQWAVVNEGIAGNRLLSDGPIASLGVSALARFDRDALSVPGVTHIVLLEGINDLGFPGAKLGELSLADPADVRSAEDLIGAYRQLISRAHARGVKVIGSTMTPCEGVDIPGYYSEAKEATRQAVNKWIRTSAAFDGVIDFDAVMRDPDHPSRLLPRLASEDHLHPNDAGYQAMADAIDLTVFQ
jgi:lysophospholipase L1-like esterase